MRKSLFPLHPTLLPRLHCLCSHLRERLDELRRPLEINVVTLLGALRPPLQLRRHRLLQIGLHTGKERQSERLVMSSNRLNPEHVAEQID